MGSHQAYSQPGTILFTDNFESGLGQWVIDNTGGGDSGISGATFNSANNSLYTRWTVVIATSIAFNANVPAADLDIWIRRGDDAFSEDPDGVENLIVEYLNNVGGWVILNTYVGGGTPGQIYTPTFNLPANALHAALQIRVRQTGGNGNDWDYWHIDDVIVTERAPPPTIPLGTCDNFEGGLGNWTVDNSGGGDSSIGGETFNSATNSLRLRWNVVTTTSNLVNYSSVTEGTVSAWIRRGSDVFSENPDAGEDLVVEYLNNGGSWSALETFIGNGPQGQIFNRSYILPANGLHASFRLRFRQTGGSGNDWDYWHVDDVCFLNTSPAANAYYQMDEVAWVGNPGEVLDSSGNNNHGNRIGNPVTASATPAIAGDPGTCGYGSFPNNTNAATIDAVDTTITPNATGSISFWYNSNTNWSGGGSQNQLLLDASANLGNNNADKFFFLVKRGNGRLRLVIEDSADTESRAETGGFGFASGTWVHIAITWDLTNDRTEIYVNGVLSATDTTNVNGTPGAWNSLYLGDNRTSGVGGSGFTGRSSNGLIDEPRIYGTAISQPVVLADMASTHPCALADHFDINHDGTAVTCQAETITIETHQADHSIDTSYTGTLNLSTSTTRGDWTLITGGGVLDNLIANDGIATYNMVAGDLGVVVLGLKNTTVEIVNINVTDTVISETSGTATAAEDPNLDFAESGFQFLANGVASTIGTQIGGKTSNVAPGAQTLELQAIRTSDSSGACEAALQGSVDIELAFECENPTTCTARQVNISGTNIAGNNAGPIATYTSVSLDFGNASDTTATFTLNYPDSGQIQLHARYNIPLDDGVPTSSGNYMLGSSNSFIVKPFGFYTVASGNPAASTAAGASYTQAGAAFTTTVSAVLWQAADDGDTNGIPDGYGDTNPINNANLADNIVAINYGQEIVTENVGLSSTLFLPSPGNDPGLSGTTTISSFTNGVGSSSVNYTEVGIIEIAAHVNDSNFLGAGDAFGRSTYVGRFYPDHYRLTAGTITNRINMACAPVSSFTYMGENFRLEFTLTAEHTGNGTTQNYIGAFAKLDPTVIASLNIGVIDTAAPTPLTARVNPVSSSGGWTAGASNVFATISLNRLVALDGPYQSLATGVDPVDSDGVRLNTYDLDVDNDTTDDHGLVASTDVRFGRIVLENIFGSELIPLTLPVHAEYFNGTQFIRNLNDSCTTYNSAGLTFSNRVDLSADPTAAGNGTLITGSFDTLNPITLDSNDETGSIDATLTVPTWLRFDWDNDSNHDNNPNSHVTFGIFSGSGQQIYIREIY